MTNSPKSPDIESPATNQVATPGTDLAADHPAPAGTAGTDDERRRPYRAPGRASRVMNRIMIGLTRMGLPTRGSVVLSVRGRATGSTQRVPINLLELGGERYVVAPRGQTEWVRNLRADGGVGSYRRRGAAVEFVAVELDDDHKAPILAAYLERWSKETARFFDPLTAQSSPAEFAQQASRFPVFRLT